VVAHLAQHPALAARLGFQHLVAAFGLARLRPVDPQPSVALRIEAESLDRAGAALFVHRRRVPQLAPVARHQQERIARDGAQLLPADPAAFEIEELDLVEPGRADALVRLVPGLAVVFAGQQDREQGGAFGVEIAGEEDPAGRGIQRRQFQVHRAGLPAGAGQSESPDVLLGALEEHAHGRARVFELLRLDRGGQQQTA